MYLPIPTQKACAQAWLKATQAVDKEQGHEAFNVVIDVREPLAQTEADLAVTKLVDGFLRGHGAMPLQAVANTIFPEPLYYRHGRPDLYKAYRRVFDRIRRKQGDWGRYFDRMTRCSTTRGECINPLENIVEKMRHHVHSDGRTFRYVYELSVYDPERDAGPVMNRQCLSFLSFKLDDQNRVMLTAIYRNHYYMTRLLGNLIGLSRLLSFIGNEVEVGVGPLTVISSHAEIDSGAGPASWTRGETQTLLEACAAAYEKETAA